MPTKKAMGIELLELDGNDLIKWTTFLGKVQKDQTVYPYAAADAGKKKSDFEKQTPGYTIRFKSIDYAKKFFPQEPTGNFFIPSVIHREPGTKIKISMIHPENDVLMHFHAIVTKYGPSVKKENILGIYFKFEDLSPALKHQINIFLNHPHYK